MKPINWEALWGWQKVCLICIAEMLWILIIFLVVSFSVWDFKAMILWTSLRLILGVWGVTWLVFGLHRAYIAFLKHK